MMHILENKLLPILLVVVLSGCGPSAFEKQCYEKFENNRNLNKNDTIGFADGSSMTVKKYCYEVGVHRGAIR